jgi:hypothetical protein
VSVHAFADESRRGQVYRVAAALVDPADLARLRKQLRTLLLPGQRELHFKRETAERGRMIISRMVAAQARVRVYMRSCADGEEIARQVCLTRLVSDLVIDGAHRLVLDARADRDAHDQRTIRAVLGKHPRDLGLTYEHLDSASEPLLWLADATAWCVGAGGDWARRIAPVLAGVVDLDRP